MSSDIKHVLKRYWGYDAFRPLQEEIIRSVIAGKDTLALMPTGGGKSLTYQVSGMVLPGICLVVTPLIALMKDQVEDLKERQIPAEAIYTGMKPERITSIINKSVHDTVKFLYISPERLTSGHFREKLRLMHLSLIAVDEAHCISQWGHDFRPAYRRVAEAREHFPSVPILALTATATPEVAKDIQEQLHFATPNVLSKSFRRDNISYVIRETKVPLPEIYSILSKTPGSAIVYTRSRLETTTISSFLNKAGIRSDFYHAGLSPYQRSRRQEAWKRGDVPVIVATNAFGMGIDKADVRVVIHRDIPDSPEAYFQEAGRAGRDGQRAYAVLLVTPGSRAALQRRVDNAFPPREYIKRVYEALCNYCELGEGEGAGCIFEFDEDELVEDFDIQRSRGMSAIKILDLAGYLSYTPDLEVPSRVVFTVPRDRLYGINTGDNPLAERLMILLMRNYTGIFVQPTGIDEDFLAKSLGASDEELKLAFTTLYRLGIIRYLPGYSKDHITFLHPRLPLSYITIDRLSYDARKHAFATKIRAMIDYRENTRTCRQLLLMAYFGQEETLPCGICDVCIAHRKEPGKRERDEMDNRILHLLSRGDLPADDLFIRLPGNPGLANDRLRALLSEGKVYLSNRGLLTVPPRE